MTTTFPVHPRLGGGQVRCFHVARRLAERFDVTLVTLDGASRAPFDGDIAPGVHEVCVPRTERHEYLQWQYEEPVGVPISDIVAGYLATETPEYLDALRDALHHAEAALLAHPFMAPALRLCGPHGLVVYDAHNAEFDLKAQMLPDTQAGSRLVAMAREVEGWAVREAGIISFVSASDRSLLVGEYGTPRARLVHVPNAVDTQGIRFVPAGRRREMRRRWLDRLWGPAHPYLGVAVFMASQHGPNMAAAERILEIAPGLPEVLFVLAGSQCDPRWGDPLPANVVLGGTLPEAMKSQVLGLADVALNPMEAGSGSNLKVLEYMAAGVPVVTTEFGRRGVALTPGVHALVAPVEGTREAILAVLGDPTGAGRMAGRARRLVEERYDWAGVVAPLTDAVASAVGIG